MSKSDVFWTIGWFLFLTTAIAICYNKMNTPLYRYVNVSNHEPTTWSSDYTLIGPVGATVNVKSYGENHVVYDQMNNLVSSGEPLTFEPGESEQPFGSSFVIVENKEYTRQGYPNIYSTEPTQLTFRVTRFGYPALFVVFLILIIISLLAIIGVVTNH